MDKKLLENFFHNTCTPSEQAEVIRWMRNPENKHLLMDWLKEHWQELDVSTSPDVNLEHVWQKIAKETQAAETIRIPRKSRPAIRWWYASAAAVVMLIATWWAITFNISKENALETVYKTEYGQLTKIRLPDSSEVVLNGNSSLTFKQLWNEKTPREVWLTGEGFFSVRHTYNHQKFTVYANKNIGVEVLGTEFSVASWKEKTRVVLNNGKIQLQVSGNETGRPVEMRPGDLAELDARQNQLVRRRVNPEVYSSWTEERLVFDNTPLSEVIQRIEQTYGVKVKMTTSLYSKRLTGKVSIENLDILLEAMENSYQLKINRTDRQITIQSR